MLAGQDVSMMFESPANIEPAQAINATSESFAEVVRLLEEEKSTLERKLDTATKVYKMENGLYPWRPKQTVGDLL